MKRKIFFIIALVAIAVIVAWNVNFSSQVHGMSDFSKANVEALSHGEDPVAVCEQLNLGWYDCSTASEHVSTSEYRKNPSNYPGYVQDYYCGNCALEWVYDPGNGCCDPNKK